MLEFIYQTDSKHLNFQMALNSILEIKLERREVRQTKQFYIFGYLLEVESESVKKTRIENFPTGPHSLSHRSRGKNELSFVLVFFVLFF